MIITLVCIDVAMDADLLRSILLSVFRRVLRTLCSTIRTCILLLRNVAARGLSNIILRIATARNRAGECALRLMIDGLRTEALHYIIVVLRTSTRLTRLISSELRLNDGLDRLLITLISEGSCRLSEDRL